MGTKTYITFQRAGQWWGLGSNPGLSAAKAQILSTASYTKNPLKATKCYINIIIMTKKRKIISDNKFLQCWLSVEITPPQTQSLVSISMPSCSMI